MPYPHLQITTPLGELTPLLIQQIVVGIAGGVILIVLVVAFFRYRKQVQHDRVVEKARTQTDLALRTIRGRINYAGQLLNNERDAATYDKVRFRNEDVAVITQTLKHAEYLYNKTQSALDTAIQQLPTHPEAEDFEVLNTVVHGLLPIIPEIEASIQASIKHRSTLEQQLNTLSQLIDTAKRTQQRLVSRLMSLGMTSRQLLKNADSHLVIAQNQLARHEYDAVPESVRQAEADYHRIEHILTTMSELRLGIDAARKAAEKAAIQGFSVQQSLDFVIRANTLCDEALSALIDGEFDLTDNFLAQAEHARSEAVAYGGNLPALQQRNGELVAQLQQHLLQLPTRIEAAHQTLAHIATFADSYWIDVRRTGQEAIVHARYAQYYVDTAQQLNSRASQQQTEVTTLLETSQQALQRSTKLLDTIIQRDQQLSQMSSIARQEYATAEEFMDRLQILITIDTSFQHTRYQDLRESFTGLQRVVDSIPFDPVASFALCRTFNNQMSDILPIETSELTMTSAVRVERLRTMLLAFMLLLENNQHISPRRLPTAMSQGLQSIRHEVNAFDAKYRTASDVTVPIVTELHTLTHQYDRLTAAMQRLLGQLLDYHAQTIRDMHQAHPQVEIVLSHLLSGKEDAVRAAQILDIDTQWVQRNISGSEAVNALLRILPHTPAVYHERNQLVVPYIQLREWGKAVSQLPHDNTSWLSTSPHLHW
jgi:hypothetical protein